jgi:uncharacterized protein (DUF488 family)
MPKLFTIGHSNRTFKDFLTLLQHHHIQHLIDVRSIPQSRHVPWTNQDPLKNALENQHISYQHMIALGGLRHTNQNSINTGWKNSSFRGYADYMQTPDFFNAIKDLNNFLTKNSGVVIMCAEAVPWRCHRSLIADAEVIRNISVCHIIGAHHSQSHQLTSFAVVERNKRPMRLFYPKCI